MTGSPVDGVVEIQRDLLDQPVSVQSVVIESSVTLQLAGRRFVSWAGRYVCVIDGASEEFDTADLGGQNSAFLLRLGTLTRVFVEAGNALRLYFASGDSITIAPNEHYESWDLDVATSGHLRLICMPEGGVVFADSQLRPLGVIFRD
jgi:Family of unknown function (DUF6188)